MSKNIIKLSSLFIVIFAAFLFIFLKTTKAANDRYAYSCVCDSADPNKLETQSYERYSTDTNFDLSKVLAACTSFCSDKKDSNGKPMILSAYKRQNGQTILVKEKPVEPKPQPLQPQEEYNENCTCSDGDTYTVDDCTDGQSNLCTVYCVDQGSTFDNCVELTSKPVADDQPDQGRQPETSQAGKCECNDGYSDISCTDTDGSCCTKICETKGGVKSYTPPPSGAEETSKTSITNPLQDINEPKDLIVKIINYVLGFVGALAVLIIIYSGFVYMTSRGNEKQIESAKNSLTYAIIGLVVIFASIIIVNAVISAIGG